MSISACLHHREISSSLVVGYRVGSKMSYHQFACRSFAHFIHALSHIYRRSVYLWYGNLKVVAAGNNITQIRRNKCEETDKRAGRKKKEEKYIKRDCLRRSELRHSRSKMAANQHFISCHTSVLYRVSLMLSLIVSINQLIAEPNFNHETELCRSVCTTTID